MMGRPSKWAVLAVVAVAAALCWLVADSVDATIGSKFKSVSIKGSVTDTHGRPLVGATVYFIDTSLIDLSPITPANILDGTAEAFDEPLEDIVNNPTKAKTLPQSKTDKNGKFAAKKLNAASTYFAFTVPAATDTDHLPGGDVSRAAFSPKSLNKKTGLAIQMSWKVPTDATYIGSSACYTCHGEGSKADVTSNKHHGHALMFHKPGQDTATQNSASHVGASWNELASKFTPATAYNKPLSGSTVETLYFQEFDTKQSNKFVIYENTPGTKVDPTTGKAGDVWLKAYLWQSGTTTNANYFITLENTMNKADPNNFVTLNVPATMGGYIRQRLLVNVPGLKGAYKFISYQALTGSASQGNMNNYDRARKVFAEGGTGGGSITDFYTPNATPSKSVIKVSATANTLGGTLAANLSGVSCAICHLGAGSYRSFIDPTTNEKLAHTVSDPNGVIDLGGDGSLQDVGISCEQCHGAGSKHREENLKTITAPAPAKKGAKTQPADTTGKFIVNPGMLGADRASLICGRCHQEGGGQNDEEANFAPPGISRAEFLTSYVKPTTKGTPTSRLWQDGVHEKGGHQSLTYSNYLLSKHSRNTKRMVACDDCHDAMGDSPFRYGLVGDPDDSQGGLCNQCHTDIDVTKHVPEKTGAAMMGTGMKCINCHMERTGRGGAGRPGLLLGTPSGVSSDANLEYWEGDQSAHIWKPVPHKFNAGVAGQQPGLAMPIPYTNSCGTCHDASKLQFQAPQ
ncbi:MAG TPA: cytochrome c3 family protein [Planctomycetota bacterium]|jgi:hypothetical protein